VKENGKEIDFSSSFPFCIGLIQCSSLPSKNLNRFNGFEILVLPVTKPADTHAGRRVGNPLPNMSYKFWKDLTDNVKLFLFRIVYHRHFIFPFIPVFFVKQKLGHKMAYIYSAGLAGAENGTLPRGGRYFIPAYFFFIY
jgi:hypothetical protein